MQRAQIDPRIVLNEGVLVDLNDPNAHSFIIKIWIEGLTEGQDHLTWHGHITHVPGGERRYLKDLDEIRFFVWPYLESLGVKPDRSLRLARWLKRLPGFARWRR